MRSEAIDSSYLGLLTDWESVAKTTRWGAYINQVERRVILMADRLAIPRTTLLDVGCGGGQWSRLLSGQGWNLICGDINPHDLSICQARLPEARCVLMDPSTQALPAGSGEANLLLCVEVFPVIKTDWFAAEATRVLKDGGVLVGVFSNRSSLRGVVSRLGASVKGGFDWYSRSYVEWRRGLRKLGFAMLYEEGICWFPFRRRSDSRLVPICARIEELSGLRRLIPFSPWIVFIARKTKPGT